MGDQWPTKLLLDACNRRGLTTYFGFISNGMCLNDARLRDVDRKNKDENGLLILNYSNFRKISWDPS